MAEKLKVVDVPDGVIKRHEKPVPYLGGAAIYVGFMASLPFAFTWDVKTAMLLACCACLLLIGLIDDMVRIKPYQKFFYQLIVAIFFLKSGFYAREFLFLNPVFNIFTSLLWILTITNAFNLVDVMDGLATTLAGCSTMILLIIAILFGQYKLAVLLTCLFGSLLAFLYYNRPPAKIYLGDAGSLFIGGFLAVVPFLFDWELHSIYGFIIPVIVLTIPLLEVSSLILIRFYKKIPIYQGSPDHFSIYLQQHGWSKLAILYFVVCISGILLVLSLLLALNKITLPCLFILLVFLLLFWFFFICIGKKLRFFRF